MVLVSALIVILSGVVVIGGIAGAFLCKSNLLRMVLLLSVLRGLSCGSCGNHLDAERERSSRRLENDRRYDRNVVCFSCGVLPFVFGTLAVVILC